MLLDAAKLITFCDSDSDARSYSAAIKAFAMEEACLALVRRYFSEQKWDPQDLGPCRAAEGFKRLDGWVGVKEDGRDIHYQVEVKSWSFHGYGENKDPLPWDCAPEHLATFMTQKFKQYWDPSAGRFKDPGLDKVLDRMQTDHLGEIRPLACLWTPIQRDGDPEKPFFRVPGVRNSRFDTVWIFSVSGYLRKHLRNGGHPIIKLDLPRMKQSLDYLRGAFPEAVTGDVEMTL